MKSKIWIIPFISMVFLLLLASCGGDDPVEVSDPAGTITLGVTSSSYLYVYKGPCLELDSIYDCVLISFSYYTGSGNVMTYTQATHDCDGPFDIYHWPKLNDEGCEISDIGVVKGLGSITNKPNTGYAYQTQLIPGHGYVIRWKKSYKYSTSKLPYFYTRFFVTEYIVSTTGGILGVTIKYQGPF